MIDNVVLVFKLYIYIYVYIYMYMSTYTYTYTHFYVIFHYGLSQDIEYNFLCYAAGLNCLSVLNKIVSIC